MWLLKSTFLSAQTIDLLCLCITITEIKMGLVCFPARPEIIFIIQNIVFSLALIVTPLLYECFYSKLLLVIRYTMSC